MSVSQNAILNLKKILKFLIISLWTIWKNESGGYIIDSVVSIQYTVKYRKGMKISHLLLVQHVKTLHYVKMLCYVKTLQYRKNYIRKTV